MTTEPTVNGEKDNRTYSSPTVLHKVLAWCLPSVQGGRMVLYVPRFQHAVFSCNHKVDLSKA